MNGERLREILPLLRPRSAEPTLFSQTVWYLFLSGLATLVILYLIRWFRLRRRRLREFSTSHVNSHWFGVEVTDRNDARTRWNHIMIPRNTPVPCQVTQRFVTNTDNPRAIYIRLLEGEVSDVESCVVIGDFRVVDLPPGLVAGSPIEVQYGYDRSGHIKVSARELVGNTEASVEIHWTGGVDDAAVAGLSRLAADYEVD